MSDRKPYVIHAKVKNNLLLSRILEQEPTVAAFCKKYLLDQGHVGALCNLKAPALNKDGTWRKIALDLALIFVLDPDDLFDEEQRHSQLKSNEAFIEMSRQQALEMVQDGCIARIEDHDMVNYLLENALTDREAFVIRQRYLGDQTLEEVAETMNLTGQRVRQIEQKALRHMRGRISADEKAKPPNAERLEKIRGPKWGIHDSGW